MTLSRPDPGEFAPYYQGYIDEIPAGEIDIRQVLGAQVEVTCGLLQNLNEKESLNRYAPGKWSIKEIVGHLIDAERVFAYRALSFARSDPNPLPSMEQDDWVRWAASDKRSLANLLDELRHVRAASLALFKSFDEEMFMRKGVASGAEFTVRTFPYIIAGHELHHQRVLKDRYL